MSVNTCLVVILFVGCYYVTAAHGTRKALVDTLLSGYSAASRPVKRDSDAVAVTVHTSLLKILSFNKETKELNINVQVAQTWTDQFLQWKPAEYSGIESLRIPASKIWSPDTVVKKEGDKDMALVFFNGTVNFAIAEDIKAECGEHYDTTKFPKDRQTCIFKLRSDSYQSAKKLTFVIESQEIDVAAMKPSALFHMDKSNIAINNASEIHEQDDDSVWPELVFSLEITRGNAEFYKHFISFPLMVLALLTALPYVMEPESPWKVPFSCAIFVAFWIFGIMLYLVMEDAVKYALGGAPLIAICWRYNAIQSSFTILQAAFTVDMCSKKTPPPLCMKKIVIGYLAPVLLCGCFQKCKERKAAKKAAESDGEQVAMTSKEDQQGDVKIEMAKEDSAAGKAEKIAEEWHTIAAVADRIFLILFLIHAILMIFWYLP